MLRVMGFLLIGTGSCGLGMQYVCNLKMRLFYLGEMDRILLLIMSQIRYHKSTLTECCRFLAGQTDSPFREGFHRVAEEMEAGGGRSFAEIYEESMSQCLEPLPLLAAEKRSFLKGLSGSSEGAAQLQLLERKSRELQEQIEKVKCEIREKGKLAIGLGTLGGLLIIVILL